jgi:arabinofuranosyltransferase
MSTQHDLRRDERPVGSTTAPVEDPPRTRPGAADWAALGIAVALFAALVWQVRAFMTDDAFISLRYARNLAEGFGPVWNPGGPPVEGFSNPLLVLLEAAVYRTFGGGGATFARALGVISGVVLVAAVWWLARPVIGPRGANAAAVLVGASPALAYWSVGGLETLPIALVMVASSLLLARADGGRAPVIGALLALLPWLRPEGLALAAALVFFSEAGWLSRPSRWRPNVARLLWLAGLPLASQAALQTLRWMWFGHLLPNSVIYKTGTGEFASVTFKFLVETAPILALAAAGFLIVPRRARLLAVVPAVYLISSLSFRDSVNTFSRLVLPALPLLLILAAAALPGAVARVRGAWSNRSALIAATAGMATVLALFAPVDIRTAAANGERYMDCRDTARRQAGAFVNDNASPDAVIAVGDAGLVPFTARRTTIDLFGLNEASLQQTGPTPAQPRADQAVAAQPDFFVLASRSPDDFRDHYSVERRVHAHPDFDGAYELATVTGPPEPCGYHMFVYERTT